MNTERMNHLITVLEGVERAKMAFDMSVWIGETDLATTENAEACGTACCAIGYAALDPIFMEQGLRLQASCRSYKDEKGNVIRNALYRHIWSREIESTRSFNEALKDAEREGDSTWMNATPIFDGLEMFDAAERFFGITEKAAFYLFDPDYYTNADDRRPIPASEVIERVREVIALGGAAPAGAGPISGNDDYDDYEDEDYSNYSDGDDFMDDEDCEPILEEHEK